MFFIVSSSIAYVLQKPLGGQVASEALAPCRFVGRCGHREKLRALDIAPLRIRDLVPRKAGADPALDHVAEADVAALARHLGRALAHPIRFPPGILRARDVAQILVGRGELGPPHGRRRGAQPQSPVETGKRRVIGPPADRYDVHPRLEPLPPDDGAGGIRAGGENVRAAIDLPRLLAGLALDPLALPDLRRQTFAGRARPAEN